MALIDCNFFSDALGMACSLTAILPQRTLERLDVTPPDDDGFPVLYLLHGLSDDHTTWVRRTALERYVAGRGVAVIMPNVHRSFYTDMYAGNRYWTFVSQELPRVCRSLFPLSAAPARTYVAGLSMGGYGAFKLALRCSGAFAAAASLSGALDLSPQSTDWTERPADLAHVFGPSEAFDGSDNDLFHLLRTAAAEGRPLPRLYACCGTEDFLLGGNRRFQEVAVELGVELTYEEQPGTHAWAYWDRHIQRVLDWLPLPPATSAP